MDSQITTFISVMQLAILTVGVVTVVFRIGKRDALVDRSIEELHILKEITKDLVKTDIEQGKSIITQIGDLKELKYRVEVLERQML